MNLSLHFDLEEAIISQTATRQGLDNTPTPYVLENMKKAAIGMENVRTLLGGRPIIISSWYRSPKVNAAVGGSPTSSHLTGWAIDFICPSYGSPFQIATKIKNSGIKYDQLIHEFGRWVHISFDPRLRQENLSIFSGTGYLKGIIERKP